jgi:hypothetical protein
MMLPRCSNEARRHLLLASRPNGLHLGVTAVQDEPQPRGLSPFIVTIIAAAVVVL